MVNEDGSAVRGSSRGRATPPAELAPLLDWLRGGRPAGERSTSRPGRRCRTAGSTCASRRSARRARRWSPGAARGRATPAPSGTSLAARHGRARRRGGRGGGRAGARAPGRDALPGLQRHHRGRRLPHRGPAAASPQVVTGVWLKRNPLGPQGGRLGGRTDRSGGRCARSTSSRPASTPGARGPRRRALAAADAGRRIERVFLGGNPLGPEGAVPLAELIAQGAVRELYVSAAGWVTRVPCGSPGAGACATGRLERLAVASNGIGPRAAARLVAAAVSAGVELLDLGRVRAAGALGAADNRDRRRGGHGLAAASPRASTAWPTWSSATPACAAARRTGCSTPPRAR